MSNKYTDVIKSLIKRDPDRMEILRVTQSLDLNDWCVGAGFVRNCVWDYLHNYDTPTPLNDIDVCYYDLAGMDPDSDKEMERTLRAKLPEHQWSLKNQARMHLKNNCAQYKSTLDAMSYWPEIQTTVGVSLEDNDDIIVRSVYPLERLFSYKIEPNPKCKSNNLALSRIKQKNWLQIWPMLSVHDIDVNAVYVSNDE